MIELPARVRAEELYKDQDIQLTSIKGYKTFSFKET